jgi:putative SOS response-associated peptidase YedK
MCGRFTLASDPAAIQAAFPGIEVPEDILSRYNVAPTQSVAVVRNTGKRQLECVRWGLIPSWAKDPKIGSKMINARAETLAEKPSFRTALRRRRCLILADGFYEWRQDTPKGAPKVPIYLRLKGGRPFAFAGLWDEWRTPQGEIWPTCTIVTTAANAVVRQFHTRMPVILRPEFYEPWLDPAEQEPAELSAALQPYAEDEMEFFVVSPRVNSTQYDSPELIQPA